MNTPRKYNTIKINVPDYLLVILYHYSSRSDSSCLVCLPSLALPQPAVHARPPPAPPLATVRFHTHAHCFSFSPSVPSALPLLVAGKRHATRVPRPPPRLGRPPPPSPASRPPPRRSPPRHRPPPSTSPSRPPTSPVSGAPAPRSFCLDLTPKSPLVLSSHSKFLFLPSGTVRQRST